jgi:monovalent cation:H+ antiporter, CPA1 family
LIANSLIFLMIGLEIKNIDFTGKWFMIAAAVIIVLVGRTVALYASVHFIKGFSRSWKAVLNWGGLKGSLSIALALSLPPSFEGRNDVLVLTFSVVLFSLLAQGLTIKPLVMKLGLSEKGKEKVN